MVLKIFFLTFSNVNIQFLEKKCIKKRHIIAKALSNTKHLKFITKKEYIKVILDDNIEI